MSWKLFSLVRSGKDDVNFMLIIFKCLEEFSSTELNIFQKLLKLQTQFLLVVIGLFQLLILSWLSFGSLWCLRNWSISFTLLNLWNMNLLSVFAYYLLVAAGFIVVCLISDIDHLCLLLYLCQSCQMFMNFIDVFKEPTCSFIDFFSIVFLLNFQWFLLQPF